MGFSFFFAAAAAFMSKIAVTGSLECVDLIHLEGLRKINVLKGLRKSVLKTLYRLLRHRFENADLIEKMSGPIANRASPSQKGKCFGLCSVAVDVWSPIESSSTLSQSDDCASVKVHRTSWPPYDTVHLYSFSFGPQKRKEILDDDQNWIEIDLREDRSTHH